MIDRELMETLVECLPKAQPVWALQLEINDDCAHIDRLSLALPYDKPDAYGWGIVGFVIEQAFLAHGVSFNHHKDGDRVVFLADPGNRAILRVCDSATEARIRAFIDWAEGKE